jgi:hydrogenase small subunit
MSEAAPTNPADMSVHVLWINAGLSCDGDSVSLTAATLPSVEDIVMGAIPGLPKVVVHWPLVDHAALGERGRAARPYGDRVLP